MAEGFDMLEEDYEEESSSPRPAGYWQAAEESCRRGTWDRR